ncbi:MAG: isochorismatase family protein [Anaerolineales bacterium]
MEKEAYFTSENILSRPEELLAGVASLRRRHEGAMRFSPDAAALLVLDMQNYFLDSTSHAFVPAAPAIVAGIARLRARFLSARRPVVFTRHLNSPQNAGMMSAWWRELITSDAAHSQIIAEFDTADCLVIEKSQYDAFWKTDLNSVLRSLAVKQVVIAGVMTHLCCETTARSAFMRGYQVFFLVDGTATYTEAFHCASLLTLSHGFALPVLVGEIEGAFDD